MVREDRPFACSTVRRGGGRRIHSIPLLFADASRSLPLPHTLGLFLHTATLGEKGDGSNGGGTSCEKGRKRPSRGSSSSSSRRRRQIRTAQQGRTHKKRGAADPSSFFREIPPRCQDKNDTRRRVSFARRRRLLICSQILFLLPPPPTGVRCYLDLLPPSFPPSPFLQSRQNGR